MFIRIKKIKGMEYAYLVKSVWEGSAARQRVVKYLGKVYIPIKLYPITFAEFCQKENKTITLQTTYKEYISSLMEWVLYQYGFVKDPLSQKKWIFSNGKVVGDPEKLTISSGKKEVTLKVNDGYMNTFTLNELTILKISKNTEEQRKAATMLAKAFVNAGIAIPQIIFIDIFQRVYT